MRRACLLAVVLGMVPATPALAQDSACTYDTCALRLAGRGRMTMVRGVNSERVARAGFFGFAPELLWFAERSDSAAYYYDRFRSANNTSNTLFFIGTIPLAILSVTALVEPNAEADWLALGLLASFTVSWTAGLIVGLPAPDRLSRAVWWYNRTLPPAAPPRD